jgi:Na+/H+ antiporter NhaD/arsenite permease-like protein
VGCGGETDAASVTTIENLQHLGRTLGIAQREIEIRNAVECAAFADHTLTLLLGMMIVVANLRLSGFFTHASAWVMRRAHHPLALLAAVTAIAGAFSAFLVNDGICLVLTPLVL